MIWKNTGKIRLEKIYIMCAKNFFQDHSFWYFKVIVIFFNEITYFYLCNNVIHKKTKSIIHDMLFFRWPWILKNHIYMGKKINILKCFLMIFVCFISLVYKIFKMISILNIFAICFHTFSNAINKWLFRTFNDFQAIYAYRILLCMFSVMEIL